MKTQKTNCTRFSIKIAYLAKVTVCCPYNELGRYNVEKSVANYSDHFVGFLFMQALRFLGLLCGSCCKYMPILVADKVSVLNDLPITLSTLLSGTGWDMAAVSVASYIWTSTDRIHDWVRHRESANYLQIDRSENDTADVLLRLLHRTSTSLKEYLPVDKQLRLANMHFT